jgi:hypothetical protein
MSVRFPHFVKATKYCKTHCAGGGVVWPVEQLRIQGVHQKTVDSRHHQVAAGDYTEYQDSLRVVAAANRRV